MNEQSEIFIRRMAPTLVAVVIAFWTIFTVFPVQAHAEAKPFGITEFSFEMIEKTEELDFGPITSGGELYEFHNSPYTFTQAGGHPWAFNTRGELTTEEIDLHKTSGSKLALAPTRDPKDLAASLPAGQTTTSNSGEQLASAGSEG